MNKAVLIDRDGTITRDVNYCRCPEDLELLPGVRAGIRLLNENNFKIVVITNQSGIARGYFTEGMLAKMHQKMVGELEAHGAHVDAIYYCPHHPDADCECRKPKPKMAYQAINDFEIDCGRSCVIGDRLKDVQLARAIGCRSVMIDNDLGRNELRDSPVVPDYVAPDLESAVTWIIEQDKISSEG